MQQRGASHPMPIATPSAADTDDDDRPLLKVEDVAKRWRCSTRQVFKLVASGDLQAVCLPGTRSLRFRAADIRPVPRPPRRPAA